MRFQRGEAVGELPVSSDRKLHATALPGLPEAVEGASEQRRPSPESGARRRVDDGFMCFGKAKAVRGVFQKEVAFVVYETHERGPVRALPARASGAVVVPRDVARPPRLLVRRRLEETERAI